MKPDYIWQPADHAWTRDSHVARFMRTRGIKTLAELRQASVHCHQWFWDEILRDMGLEWTRRYTQVRDNSRGFAWTRWFVGGQINITHNCVDRHVRDGHGGETALFFETAGVDAAGTRRVTFAELAELVNRCMAGLRAAGLQRGDTVALYAPMQVASVVVMFATMKLGARFLPLSTKLGEAAIRERLHTCEAKIIFAGSALPVGDDGAATALVIETTIRTVPSISRIVWTDRADWVEFLQSGVCLVPRKDPLAAGAAPDVTGEITAAEDPCLVLYTSGTNGPPKATIHTHAGCLAQMGKELRYAFDVRPGEPFFWIADIAELMGPWAIIGCLLYRTPVVLLEGAARSLRGDQIWQICEKLKVVTFGGRPSAIRQLQRETLNAGRGSQNDLTHLRVLGSAGEAWDESSYHWFFEEVGSRRCPIMNLASCPEMAGCLLQPYPVEPVATLSVGGPALGIDLDLFTDDGRATRRGEIGTLVCKQPVPSMTKGLLGEDGRYLETFFTRFPGVWDQGDHAYVDRDGQWYLCGRHADAVAAGHDLKAEPIGMR
jgi:acetyl-CoA synthetase